MEMMIQSFKSLICLFLSRVCVLNTFMCEYRRYQQPDMVAGIFSNHKMLNLMVLAEP